MWSPLICQVTSIAVHPSAAAEPISLAEWAFDSLGRFYGWLIPVVALLVFLGACLVVALNRRPSVIAAYLVVLPLPALIGIYATLSGFITGYSVFFSAAEGDPGVSFAQHVTLVASCLVSSLFGLLLTAPSYVILAVGLFVRALLYRPTVANR